ncbi:DUF397 domain-containing protein [Actinomycetospora flava]|uniref:DUF397 domain-containing protein n=1 Tax=Actinomycetospora flava TaxID=3129232 RepID=A0ABU8M8L0_9PSEU
MRVVTDSPLAGDLFVRRSSFCSDGGCVGVAMAGDEVRVVDTKSSEALRFTPEEWAAFVAGVKAGEFDLPR